jgi:RNA polymerase sigma-70 factor, ECF subfamily
VIGLAWNTGRRTSVDVRLAPAVTVGCRPLVSGTVLVDLLNSGAANSTEPRHPDGQPCMTRERLSASSFAENRPKEQTEPRGWGAPIMTITLPRNTTVRPQNWNETAELVELAQAGDRDAFGALVEQFQRTVYAIALGRLGNPSEALELTQEVFLHVMRRIDQLREPERFAGWLRQVAVRMAINRATRRVAPPSVEDGVLEAASGHRDEPLDELILRERAKHLWDGLNRLKPLDREALVLFYIQGLSLLEIADQLDAPVGTIKRRLHIARKRLKEELKGCVADADEWSDGMADPDEDEAELALAIA